MIEFEKDILRKLNVRKFAFENMGNESEPACEQSTDDAALQRRLKLLDDNIRSAEQCKNQDGYWHIVSHKKIVGNIVVFMKKAFRKLLKICWGWYIFPIYLRQSTFNGKMVNAVALLNEMREMQQVELTEIKHQNASLQSTLDRRYEEQEERIRELATELAVRFVENEYFSKSINQVNEKLTGYDKELSDLARKGERFERRVAPGLRDAVKCKLPGIIPKLNDKILKQCELDVREANTDPVERSEKLNRMKEEYRRLLIDQLDSATGPIVVLTSGFMNFGSMEAINNEAQAMLERLKRDSKYRTVLVSIETEVKDNSDILEEIIYTTEDSVADRLAKLLPSLIIACFSTTYICGVFLHDLISKYPVLYRLTSQNLMQGFNQEIENSILHMNELKEHRYLAASQYAAKTLTDNGFRFVQVMDPVMSLPKYFYREIPPQRPVKLVVGFASSPMALDELENRGISLLAETVKKTPEVDFIVLWRNPEIPVPTELREAPNCKLRFGRKDMGEFYHEINCLAIFYVSINNNHACSLSAVEAMMNGIPVICTDVSGISELVAETGMGLICPSDATSFNTAILELKNSYSNYTDLEKMHCIRNRIRNVPFIDIAEETIEEYSTIFAPTLDEWDAAVRNKGRYLVIGHENIKVYYQNSEIAENYTTDRFEDYPINCFNVYEKQTIDLILERELHGKSSIILDIACGDGRIVEENLKHGHCVAADSSQAMLDIVMRRNEGNEFLSVELVDYFVEDIEEEFDAITVFRYLRHFNSKERKIIYHKIWGNLKPGGMLLFDAPNREFELLNRKQTDWGNYNIYDVFQDLDSITEELAANRFDVKYALPVGEDLEFVKGMPGMPITWTIGAIKRRV